jgi:hypothetical protein
VRKTKKRRQEIMGENNNGKKQKVGRGTVFYYSLVFVVMRPQVELVLQIFQIYLSPMQNGFTATGLLV